MQRILGNRQPTLAEPAAEGEVRWIERLQQQPASPPAASIAGDAGEAGLWIRRLQQRAGKRAL